MKFTPAPVVMLVSQRHSADCGISALAMFLGVSYEDAFALLGDHRILRSGVWMTQLARAAARCGVVLRRKRPGGYDLEHADGLLQIRHRRGPQHVVLVRAGLLWDTDCSAWEPVDYLPARGGRFGMLLDRVE